MRKQSDAKKSMSLDSDDEDCFERALTPTQLETASRHAVELAESLKTRFPPMSGEIREGWVRLQMRQLTIEHFFLQNIER